MKNQNKRERILDAAQELMETSSIRSVSVQKIAQNAGIGKGSIYYYFSSKNEIIEAVIERSYFRVLDEAQTLVASQAIGVFEKMKIIYQACLDSSIEFKRQEAISSFNVQQQSALIHQTFAQVIISRMQPILADIFRQGMNEGILCCDYPEETARIVLMVLTVTLDNSLAPTDARQIRRVLSAFAQMQEKTMEIPKNTLDFLAVNGAEKSSLEKERPDKEQEEKG